MRSPSGSSPMAGMVRARAPVATMTCFAVSLRAPTETVGATDPFSSLAVPTTTSILCFFIR